MTVKQQDLIDLLSACGAPGTAAGQDGPVFEQPWHAEVIATTLNLSRNGVFSWNEWVDRFSKHIAGAPQQPGEDANTAYYRQWLSALEAILAERKIIDRLAIDQAKEDWRRSYLHTEHGQPVVFRRELPEPHIHEDEDDHHHHHNGAGAPVSISPATP